MLHLLLVDEEGNVTGTCHASSVTIDTSPHQHCAISIESGFLEEVVTQFLAVPFQAELPRKDRQEKHWVDNCQIDWSREER